MLYNRISDGRRNKMDWGGNGDGGGDDCSAVCKEPILAYFLFPERSEMREREREKIFGNKRWMNKH